MYLHSFVLQAKEVPPHVVRNPWPSRLLANRRREGMGVIRNSRRITPLLPSHASFHRLLVLGTIGIRITVIVLVLHCLGLGNRLENGSIGKESGKLWIVEMTIGPGIVAKFAHDVAAWWWGSETCCYDMSTTTNHGRRDKPRSAVDWLLGLVVSLYSLFHSPKSSREG